MEGSLPPSITDTINQFCQVALYETATGMANNAETA